MPRLTMRLLSAALLVGSMGSVLADTPGADWISADQAKAKLMAAGYSSVTSIEADDGRYEGKGMKDGVIHEFHVDPYTGAVTKDEAKH